MQWWLWRWQYLIPPSWFFFHVDWVIIPALNRNGFSFWKTYLIAIVIGTIELFVQYYFFNWFREEVVLKTLKKKASEDGLIKEGVELVQQIRIQPYGISNHIRNYCFKVYTSATNPENKTVKKIKKGGYGIMFVLGIEPLTGGRLFGVIQCGAIGWRNGLYPLIVGNALRMLGIVKIWGYILSLWDYTLASL